MANNKESLASNPQACLVLRKAIENLPLQLWPADGMARRMALLEDLSAMAGKTATTSLREGDTETEKRLRSRVQSTLK